MVNPYVVAEQLESVLDKTIRLPTAAMWNRLEGRPRRRDFSRALRAEVRDPLWLLTRQWQMGEFLGEDAGSPVVAKVAWKTDEVAALRTANGQTKAYTRDELPLEAMIEARPVPHALDLRLSLGQRWQKLLEKSGHGVRASDYRTAYPFAAPDASAEADFPITAHAAAWQSLAAVATRAIDGFALWQHLEQAGALASDGLGLTDPEKSQIDSLGSQFVTWARARYVQPLSTWQPQHLEYNARLSAPRGNQAAALAAPEYRGGHLDWFHFDAAPAGDGDAPGQAGAPQVTSFMPTSIQFEGMPNTRHWTFEEGATNFGDIAPDTPDLAKLLLIEFGLVFANDWFLLPLDLPLGSLTEIRGLAVSNVFGERFWVEPAVSVNGPVQSFQMFRLTNKGAADGRLFLPATTPAGLESAPIESVSFVRDEVSNMVWGIETAVQLRDGSTRRGREVALELHAKHQAHVSSPAAAGPANQATIKYTLMRSVPENWIPFIPVHIEGQNREVQLQRASMPRLLEGQEGVRPAKIAPRTNLLREGLDRATPAGYFLAEEEVERAGTVIETRWQRCRWLDGRVVTWLSHQRKVGRGESSSGLAFDLLVPKTGGGRE